MIARVLPSRVVLGSNNAGKLVEVNAILGAVGVEVVPVGQVLAGWSVEETGETFEANALLKARDLVARAGAPVLADDSGLEVAALGGRPGVRSARYAGEAATDDENVALLLREMAAVPGGGRAAAFRCVMALVWPDGAVVTAAGSCPGVISTAPRGAGGFGYDPVFLDPETNQTFAELSPAAKNARSHRRRALDALVAEFAGSPPAAAADTRST